MLVKRGPNIPLQVVCVIEEDSSKNKMIKISKSTSTSNNVEVDVEELIKRYEGTPVIDEMQKRPNSFLWVRARSIDANVPNENGDMFKEEQLLEEVDAGPKKGKIPAFKTFEGVPIYTNHKNDNIEEAKGKVVFAEWDDKDKCVYCTFYIDSEAYPSLARGVKEGYIHDVSMGCFLPGTRILTSNGYKNVEDIEIEDILVDGDGKFSKITNRQRRYYIGDTLKIELEGGETIKCTPNHKFPTLKVQEYCLCGCGEELDQNVSNQPSTKYEKRFKVGHHQNVYNSISEYSDEEILKTKLIRNLKGKIEIDEKESRLLKPGDFLLFPKEIEQVESDINNDLARLIGYFLAEGSYTKYKDKLSQAVFTFALDEKNTLAQEVIDIIKNQFNVDCSTREKLDKNTFDVYTSSKEVIEFLYVNCGGYSCDKKLKNELLFANSEIKKHIIGAWLNGDGCIRILVNRKDPDTLQGVTVSRELAEQLHFMLNSCGIYHTISSGIEGKFVRYSDSKEYPNSFRGENRKRIFYTISIPSTYCSLISEYTGFVGNFSNKKYFRDIENYLLRKISNIELDDYEGIVYNFETENDSHSYIVENCATKNCSVDFSKCSICGHQAKSEDQYCTHVKEHKGRKFSGVVNGKKFQDAPVYEINYGVKFIELSAVSDGAFEACEVEEILPTEEILQKIGVISKTSEKINNLAREALYDPEINDVDEIRNVIIDVININDDIKKIANSKSKMLKSSQEPIPDFNNQALSTNDLESPADQFMNIEPVSSRADGSTAPGVEGMAPDVPVPSAGDEQAQTKQSVFELMQRLDELNKMDLAQKILEATVVDLIGKRRNVNMEHVSDLTKHLAGVQEVVSNLIDDGFKPEAFGTNIPIGLTQSPDQAGMTNGQQPPPQPQIQEYAPAGDVGLQMSASKNMDKTKIGGFEIFKKMKNKYSDKEKKDMDNFVKLSQIIKDQYTDQIVDKYEKEQGSFKVAISSRGEIKGYFKGSEIEWTPSISDEQLERLAEGEISSVTGELLGQLKMAEKEGTIKTAKREAEVPKRQTEVRFQDETEEYPTGRLGNPVYPEENYVGEARKEVDNTVHEQRLEDSRTGVDNTVHEQRLEKYNPKGELGRQGFEVDVQEHKLEDSRRGTDNTVHEQRLEAKRSGSSTAKEVVASLNNAIAKAIVDAAVSPMEIIESAIKLSSTEDLNEKISENTTPNLKKARRDWRERQSFNRSIGQKIASVSDKALEDYIVGSLADVASEEVMPIDLSEGIKLIASIDKDKYVKTIEKLAKELIVDNNISKDTILQRGNRTDDIKKAFVGSLDPGKEEKLSSEHLKHSVVALADTVFDTESTAQDILEVVASLKTEDLSREIESARTEDATNKRVAIKERASFWNIKLAEITDKQSVIENLVGNIADVANQNDISSPTIAKAVECLSAYPATSKKLISDATKAKINFIKNAATITDRSDREFRVSFNLNECGCRKDDSELESKVKPYVIQLFANRGYELSDPDSLTFTELNISENGDVCGVIKSSITRTLQSDPAPEEGVALGVVADNKIDIFSDGMLKKRSSSRRDLLKAAQAMPGAMQGAAPMGGDPMAAGPGADPAAGALGGDGLSAITGGGGGEPVGEEGQVSPEESLPTPGEIAPPGSICPACGSTDVDLAEGHGQCNSCSTEFEYTFDIKIINPENFESGGNSMSEEEVPEEGLGLGEELNPGAEPGGAEMGAQAPGAAAGGMGGGLPGAGGPGGAPLPGLAKSERRTVLAGENPLAVKISWVTNPDDFIKTAMNYGEKTQPGKPMSVGHVCPYCGERHKLRRVAGKDKTKIYCNSCFNVAVAKTKAEDGKVISEIIALY